MPCYSFIMHTIRLIPDDEDEIESCEKRNWKSYVFKNVLVRVVLSHFWICSGQDACSCIKCCHDSSLRDACSLLLHHLMKCGSVFVSHLVKFVDAGNPKIRKHSCARFKHQHPILLLDDGSCEPCGGRTPAACEQAARSDSCHVLGAPILLFQDRRQEVLRY